jgi:hypothetical protein
MRIIASPVCSWMSFKAYVPFSAIGTRMRVASVNLSIHFGNITNIATIWTSLMTIGRYVFSGFCVTRSLVYMYVLSIIVCPFVLFLLAIVLSALLRYTVSDSPFSIFKLFFDYFEIEITNFTHSIRNMIDTSTMMEPVAK